MRSFVFAAVVAACIAAVCGQVFIERDTALPVQRGWKVTGTRAGPEALATTRTITMALNGNYAKLEAIFEDISDPRNSAYGNYLTNDEITALVAPHDEVLAKVSAFFNSVEGVSFSFTGNKDYVIAEAPLSALETLFGVEYTMFEHETGLVVPATMGPYSVSADIAEHVAFVTAVVDLPDVHVAKQRKPAPFKDGSEINPDVIRAAYGVTDSMGKGGNNSVAVAEFQGQYYSPAALSAFYKAFLPGKSVPKVTVKGPNDGSGIEADLDIQYILGVSQFEDGDGKVVFYSYSSFNFFGDLSQFLAELQNEAEIPMVISISYGSQGNYPSASYRTRSDTEYLKISSRGVSVIYASGDSGSGYSFGGMHASYPATSPHVTSVGATGFQNGNTGPRRAVAAFKSGGGTSDLFTMPDYQKDAIAGYLKSGVNMPSGHGGYHPTNRWTADVSALGSEHFVVYVESGQSTLVGGTSASSPSFAAMVALANQERIKAGKPSLGFLNKFLYQNPHVFTDITVGDNKISGVGYECAPGYDAPTGLGEVNYPEFLKAALAA